MLKREMTFFFFFFVTGIILAPEQDSFITQNVEEHERKEGGKKPWIDAPSTFFRKLK